MQGPQRACGGSTIRLRAIVPFRETCPPFMRNWRMFSSHSVICVRHQWIGHFRLSVSCLPGRRGADAAAPSRLRRGESYVQLKLDRRYSSLSYDVLVAIGRRTPSERRAVGRVPVSGRFGLSRVACPPFEGKLNYYSDKCYVMYACLCYLARWPPGVGFEGRVAPPCAPGFVSTRSVRVGALVQHAVRMLIEISRPALWRPHRHVARVHRFAV
jgi:hypothetical protein